VLRFFPLPGKKAQRDEDVGIILIGENREGEAFNCIPLYAHTYLAIPISNLDLRKIRLIQSIPELNYRLIRGGTVL
jgi:hypothetical protein